MAYHDFWNIHQIIIDVILVFILIAVIRFSKDEAKRDEKLLKKNKGIKKTVVIHKSKKVGK